MTRKSILLTSIILTASIIAIVTSQNAYANPPHDAQASYTFSQSGGLYTYTVSITNISTQPQWSIYDWRFGQACSTSSANPSNTFQSVSFVTLPTDWNGYSNPNFGISFGKISGGINYPTNIQPGATATFTFTSTTVPQLSYPIVVYWADSATGTFGGPCHGPTATGTIVQPPPPLPQTQANVTVIETVELRWVRMQPNEMYVLLDTSGAGTLNQVNVTANLPCNGGLGPTPGANNDVPDLVVLAGDFPGTLTRFISNALDDTGAVSTANTCIFEDGITSATSGPISSVVLWNNSSSTVTLQRNILFAISGN